jgi:hypothetical protein
MPLPPRLFHPLTDVANDWSVVPLDIVDWAIGGLLELSLAAAPTKTDSGKTLFGLVEIAGADVRQLFLPGAVAETAVAIRRMREHGQTEWQWISEPAAGLIAALRDIFIVQSEVESFAQRFGVDRDARYGNTKQPSQPPPRTRPAGPGAPPRYDWDRFFVEITRRIFVHGLPRTQSELVREMADWFHTRGRPPDESTIRRKVALVWRELMGACALPFIPGYFEFIIDCSAVLL